jgi:hypothetical protein
MIQLQGDVGSASGFRDPEGPFPGKTFWFSVHFLGGSKESTPAIGVTGTRLDGTGTFQFGNPGTNAGADFGSAMLVGVDFPTIGCWRLTARYRGFELAYVIQITDD